MEKVLSCILGHKWFNDVVEFNGNILVTLFSNVIGIS